MESSANDRGWLKTFQQGNLILINTMFRKLQMRISNWEQAAGMCY
jgi:hypothetical protein